MFDLSNEDRKEILDYCIYDSNLRLLQTPKDLQIMQCSLIEFYYFNYGFDHLSLNVSMMENKIC